MRVIVAHWLSVLLVRVKRSSEKTIANIASEAVSVILLVLVLEIRASQRPAKKQPRQKCETHNGKTNKTKFTHGILCISRNRASGSTRDPCA